MPDKKSLEKPIVVRIVGEPAWVCQTYPEWTERDKMNLIKSRPTRAKTGLAGRENGIGLQK